MEMLGSLFTVLLLVGAASGLQWSEKLKRGAGPVQVCSGENIQLLFNFTLDQGERLKGIVWGCQPEGEVEGVLATYTDDHFVPTSSFSGRLAHLQNGGIELSCATILESGNYSIAVSTEDTAGEMTVHRKTVPVTVVDTPKTWTGELHVTRTEEAVRDVITGAWHVQLSCGNFSDRGHPPIDVIWKTPKGVQLDSTSYRDGFFHLLLPNPLAGGTYSCNIVPSEATARCMDEDSPLMDAVSVEVDQVAGRFTLLEARQQELMDRLDTDRKVWMGAVEDMGNRTDALGLQLDREALLRQSDPISFHATLTDDVQLSEGSILKLDNVISNQGDGYNPGTGIFTAPVNGTYFFIGTARPVSRSDSNMRLMTEGRSTLAETKLYNANSRTMGSCHGAVYLTAGERVWLESSYSNSYFLADVTSFTGFRL